MDKTKKEDREWGARQDELNESMLQGGKAFWPNIQIVSGKKIRVGAVPFQRRVLVQLEKHSKVALKDAHGVPTEMTKTAAELTMELNEWRVFTSHVDTIKEFIKTAEKADHFDTVPNFLKTCLGETDLYDWGKFGQESSANIAKFRLGKLNLVLIFVWSDKEYGKSPNCSVALGRGFVCRDSGKMLARTNQTVYLSGAALDYLFSEKLDVIENAIRAWSDMIKYSQKLIYSCRPGYDPRGSLAAMFTDEELKRRVSIQE